MISQNTSQRADAATQTAAVVSITRMSHSASPNTWNITFSIALTLAKFNGDVWKRGVVIQRVAPVTSRRETLVFKYATQLFRYANCCRKNRGRPITPSCRAIMSRHGPMPPHNPSMTSHTRSHALQLTLGTVQMYSKRGGCQITLPASGTRVRALCEAHRREQRDAPRPSAATEHAIINAVLKCESCACSLDSALAPVCACCAQRSQSQRFSQPSTICCQHTASGALRALRNAMRQVVDSAIVHGWLYDADVALASALRVRCGLSVKASEGWLVAVPTTFEQKQWRDSAEL